MGLGAFIGVQSKTTALARSVSRPKCIFIPEDEDCFVRNGKVIAQPNDAEQFFNRTEASISSRDLNNNSTFSVKVKNLKANRYVYLCLGVDYPICIMRLGYTVDGSSASFGAFYETGYSFAASNYVTLRVYAHPMSIGCGSIVNIERSAIAGSMPSFYGIAFCESAHSTWDEIPSGEKCLFT